MGTCGDKTSDQNLEIKHMRQSSGSPVDLISSAEALLVSLRSLCELQRLLERSFIGQQPAQGARDAVASSGCGCGSTGRGGGCGGPGAPEAAAAAADPEAESRPLPWQRQPLMTDPLTAHASPSDTSFSPDWGEERAGGELFTN